MNTLYTVELYTTTCGQCGGVYAISEQVRSHRQRHAGGWNCPYCQTCWSYSESEAERLKKQLAAERAAHDQTKAARDEAQRQVTAERARVELETKKRKKAEKRAACGVCPYCKRSFASTRMARHVATKHPECVS